MESRKLESRNEKPFQLKIKTKSRQYDEVWNDSKKQFKGIVSKNKC